MRIPFYLASLVAVALSGCGDDGGGGPPPEIGEACEEDFAPRCGLPGGSEDETTVVVVCQASVVTLGLACPQAELCFEDESRRAPACRDVNDFTVYGVADEPCVVDGSTACDFSQDRILACQGGVWGLQESCSADGRRCQTLRDIDEGCDDSDGCVVCEV